MKDNVKKFMTVLNTDRATMMMPYFLAFESFLRVSRYTPMMKPIKGMNNANIIPKINAAVWLFSTAGV